MRVLGRGRASETGKLNDQGQSVLFCVIGGLPAKIGLSTMAGWLDGYIIRKPRSDQCRYFQLTIHMGPETFNVVGTDLKRHQLTLMHLDQERLDRHSLTNYCRAVCRLEDTILFTSICNLLPNTPNSLNWTLGVRWGCLVNLTADRPYHGNSVRCCHAIYLSTAYILLSVGT